MLAHNRISAIKADHFNFLPVFFLFIVLSLTIYIAEGTNTSGFSDINKKALSMNFKKEPKGIELTPLTKYPYSHTYQYDYHRIYDVVKNRSVGFEEPTDFKYELSIIAMFKNEAHIIIEWLEHHIGHGVEHFYLINDHSTDNPHELLAPYIEKDIVSMFPPPHHNTPFRQTAAYKKLFMEIYAAKESHWVAIIDLDEFLYSPQEVDIKKILQKHTDLSIIGVNWAWFGSSGFIDQPASVIQSFTKRADYDFSKYPKLIEHYKVLTPKKKGSTYSDWQKNIMNTEYKIDSVDIHHCVAEGISDNLSFIRYPDNPPLVLNHYSIQSKNFFLKNKGSRGDINNWVAADARNEAWFSICDINEVVDTRLADQNKKHKIALNLAKSA